MVQLTRDEIHVYATAMIDAVQTPEFQARVRAALSRAPIPADTEAVMTRYEEVQADFLANHYNDKTGVDSSMNSHGDGANISPAPKLDGGDIIEQLKKAVTVYKDAETEGLITRLCLLIEKQVESLISTEPSLQPLARHSPDGAQAPVHLAGGGAGGLQSFMNPSPQVKQMLSMAMGTLKPKQRETFERVQRTMMGGSQPTPEDMRELFLIRRQLGAFMQTMQKFGQAPGS